MSHHSIRHARRLALVLVAALLVALSGFAPGASATARSHHGGGGEPPAGPAPYDVVVGGLRNPRGLALSADGKLYVAEGGVAGDACFAGPSPEGGPDCAGFSGRISRVNTRSGTRSDYITGLLSFGGPLFAIGPSGVAVQGNQVLGLMAANDKGLPPVEACASGDCAAVLAAAPTQLGHLLRGVPSGGYRWKQDVGAFNYDWTVANKNTIGAGNPAYQPGWADNPDFMPGDANPYGLTSLPWGSLMVDGGANTLTFVPHNGTPKVLAAFPQPDPAHANAYDAVPTCVTTAGGKAIVADLNGQVFAVDGSSLTVSPAAVTSPDGAFLVSAGGCASDGKGNVYISDIFGGSVVKLDVSTMSMTWLEPMGTFVFPSGIAVGREGVVYLSTNSICPDFPTPASNDNPCSNVTGSIVRLHVGDDEHHHRH